MQPPEPLFLVVVLYNFRALSEKENKPVSIWLLGSRVLTEAALGLKALLTGNLSDAHSIDVFKRKSHWFMDRIYYTISH